MCNIPGPSCAQGRKRSGPYTAAAEGIGQYTSGARCHPKAKSGSTADRRGDLRMYFDNLTIAGILVVIAILGFMYRHRDSQADDRVQPGNPNLVTNPFEWWSQ